MTRKEKQMATKETVVQIKSIDVKKIKIRIVGDTPLIVHNWDIKAKQMMLDAQMGRTKTKARERKNPVSDFINSLYWIEGKPEEETEDGFSNAVMNGARWGFPVGAIKMAANSAAYRLGWVKNQMALRGTYYLTSEDGELAEIRGCVPTPREDMVRVGMGTADIRYRGEFKDWYMDFVLEYSEAGELSLEQILNCINAGGFSVGLGEWRPEKDGTFGRFHVETDI